MNWLLYSFSEQTQLGESTNLRKTHQARLKRLPAPWEEKDLTCANRQLVPSVFCPRPCAVCLYTHSPQNVCKGPAGGVAEKTRNNVTTTQVIIWCISAESNRWPAYPDVVACGEKPAAGEMKAGYSGAEVSSAGFREKVDTREQLVSDAMTGVLEISLGLNQGAGQHTLETHTRVSE